MTVKQATERKSKIHCAAPGIYDDQLRNNDTNDVHDLEQIDGLGLVMVRKVVRNKHTVNCQMMIDVYLLKLVSSFHMLVSA